MHGHHCRARQKGRQYRLHGSNSPAERWQKAYGVSNVRSQADCSCSAEERERELSQPGALQSAGAQDPTLGEVVDRYISESVRDLGRTKQQVLRTIKALPLADMKCSTIDSPSIVQMAQALEVKPQTVSNYVSHLAAIFAVARPAWVYQLSQQALNDARTVLHRLSAVSKSVARDRRPRLDELDTLLSHFDEARHRRSESIPMRDITAFAIFSIRRLEEICPIAWCAASQR